MCITFIIIRDTEASPLPFAHKHSDQADNHTLFWRETHTCQKAATHTAPHHVLPCAPAWLVVCTCAWPAPIGDRGVVQSHSHCQPTHTHTSGQNKCNGCTVKCCSTIDFDRSLVHTATAQVQLCAVILRKCMESTSDTRTHARTHTHTQ